MKNYYDILEVNRKASNEIIDKAYKVLAKKYHPDLYSSEEKRLNERRLKDLNEAYRVLSDDFLREQYDKELEIQEKRDNEQVQHRESKQIQDQNQEQKKNRSKRNNKNDVKVNKVGSLGSLIDLTKLLIENRPQIKEKRKLNQKDFLALGLTAVTVIIIGVILWFIPFTNGWMRELIFENPLFSWMFK